MRSKAIAAIYLSASLLVLAGCGSRHRDLRFATGPQRTISYSVGKSLADVWNRKGDAHITMLSGDRYSMVGNIDELSAGRADIGLAQNDLDAPGLISDSASSASLRTVLPLYPEVFFILYKDTLHPKSLADLVRGRRVAIGARSSGTADFAKLLFTHFGIDSASYTTVYLDIEHRELSDSVDVCCFLIGLDNAAISNGLARGHAKLFSLDDAGLANNGSAADGFCLSYQGAHPYVIPRNTFGSLPDQPVLTVAVDAVLLARADVDRVEIYDLVTTMFDNHHALADNEPLLKNVSSDFDRKLLHYPLHDGARMYLNRDEPSFVEKYADLVGVFFSLAAGIAGAVSAVVQWSKRRRKDRINEYYMEVVAIDTSAAAMTTREQCDAAMATLEELKGRAFLHLAQDKLSPDESFHILITFIDNTAMVVERRSAELARAAT
jgi:TRAP transporter TAXI family solute receptor